MNIPKNIAAEKAIIGCCIKSPLVFADCLSLGLNKNHFFDENNKRYFIALKELQDNGIDFDMSTLIGKFEKDMMKIIGICNDAPIAENVEYHINSLENCLQRRLVINACSSIISSCINSDCNANDLAQEKMSQVVRLDPKSNLETVKEISPRTLDEIENRILENKSGENSGLKSGLKRLDGELIPRVGDVIYIAARPGKGKTALGLQMAIENSKTHKVAFFSLEMCKIQIHERMIARESNITVKKLRTGNLTESEQDDFMAGFKSTLTENLLIDDEANQTIEKIRSKCRLISTRVNLKSIYIDYLQLVKTSSQFRDKRLQIDHVTKSLKSMAKELNVVVFCLAQLNREIEKRSYKKPILSDLKESGSIEEDADSVLFIYREDHGVSDREIRDDQALLILAKNRHGETGEILVGCDMSTGKFLNDHS